MRSWPSIRRGIICCNTRPLGRILFAGSSMGDVHSRTAIYAARRSSSAEAMLLSESDLLKLVAACFFGPIARFGAVGCQWREILPLRRQYLPQENMFACRARWRRSCRNRAVGQRAARLLAATEPRCGLLRATRNALASFARQFRNVLPDAKLTPVATGAAKDTANALEGAQIVIAAGAAGVELLPPDIRRAARDLKVAVDLNAVPPLESGAWR